MERARAWAERASTKRTESGAASAVAAASGRPARHGADDAGPHQLMRDDEGATCQRCNVLLFRGQHRNVDPVRSGFLERMARQVQPGNLRFLDRTDCRGQRVLVARLGIVDWQEVGAVARDAWQVQLYADNLTDTRAELFANYRQYYKAVTVNRPRTVRLRLTYRIR